MSNYLFNLRTKTRILVADIYERIVESRRGKYFEISEEHIRKEILHIPKNQKWRLNNNKCYYIWLETNDGVKIYYQKKKVSYADYKIGFYYISFDDVSINRIVDDT